MQNEENIRTGCGRFSHRFEWVIALKLAGYFAGADPFPRVGELAFHIEIVGHSLAWLLQIMALDVMGARLPEG